MRIADRTRAIFAVGIALLVGLWTPGTGRAAENEILVKFRAGVQATSIRALHQANGARLQRVIPRIGTQVLTLASAADAEQALARLRGNPLVAYAEPNRRVHALAIPDDYYFNEELMYWTAEFIEAQWPLWQIGIDAAWDIAVGDPDTVVAVIDTGTDLTHPDLTGMEVGRIDVIEPLAGTPSQDDYGHGTTMAGCAVAHTNNTDGVAGASWGCRLLSVKCLDYTGWGEFDDCAVGVIAAADWAGPGVVRVINMSWGDYFPSETLQDAIDYAHGNGIVCVTAMGNNGDDTVLWPAASNNVIAAGGTNIMGLRSSLSNTGSHISIVAPSGAAYELWDVGVLVPIPTYSTSLSDLFEYYLTPYSIFDLGAEMGVILPLAGTSFAAAHVSGVAALMVSHTPTLTPAEVQAILELTATDIPPAGWDQETGWGRVNAGAALAWEGPVFGSIEGVVTDDISGQPVEGATLTASAPPRLATGTSGEDGGYAIGNLVPGTWSLTISAPGYVTQQHTLAITAGVATHLDIVLAREVGDIAGTVVSGATGMPIAGATMTLTQVGGPGAGITITATDGTYSFLDLPVGDYEVTADASDYIPQTKAATVIYDQTTTVDFILIRKTGTISGTVTDSTTECPIIRALVMAVQTGGGWGAAYTDDAGGYAIPGLPTGTYEVTAEIDGYATGREGDVAVTWGGNTVVDFELDSSPIRVSHTFPAGWNLISLPITPEDGDPPAVFGSVPISGRLHRYDAVGMGYVTYYDFTPSAFGQMKCGDGYWLYLDSETTVAYWGFPGNGPQSIRLPADTWSLIGHPFRTAVLLADCDVRRVADGSVKGFAEAIGDGWIQQPAYTWNPAVLGYRSIGLEVPPYQDDHLRPWLGYWLASALEEVDLIVPMP